MKWLKIGALLLATLIAMRAGSWAIAWAVVRLSAAKLQTAALVANVVAFGVFIALLQVNTFPGEPFDWAAALFGVLVFAIYAASDFVWKPWSPKTRPK